MLKIILTLSLLTACALKTISRSSLKEKTAKPMNEQLRPFSSDGCSLWQEGTQKEPVKWIRCCLKHDMAYWIGGTGKQRKQADKMFKGCVEKNNPDLYAFGFFSMVRLMGRPQIESSFKWGYGWNYKRGYVALNEIEKEYIRSIIPKTKKDLINSINSEIIDKRITPEHLEALDYSHVLNFYSEI